MVPDSRKLDQPVIPLILFFSSKDNILKSILLSLHEGP